MEYTDERELESAVEGILFASGEPVQVDRICLALELERHDVERILYRLRDYYAYERRGVRLLQLEDRWQLCSSPDHADAIRKAFEIRKPAKLSQPALEALTIIAYYQPTTRAYVDKLRGVDSAYTVGLLLERGLIETCGHLQAPGRPLLYRTTEKFLRSFHIRSLDELPPLNPDELPPRQMNIDELPQVVAEDAPENSEAAETVTTPETTEAAPEVEETAQVEAAPEVEETAQVEETAEVEETPQVEAAAEVETPSEAEETPQAYTTRELLSMGTPPRVTARGKRTRRKRRAAPRLADAFRVVRRRKKRRRHRTSRTRPAPSATETASELETDASSKTETASGTETTETPSEGKVATVETASETETTETASGTETTETPSEAETMETLSGTETAETASVSGTGTAENGAVSGQQERKLSGKAVRRCLDCLLCGCWLSWPFWLL